MNPREIADSRLARGEITLEEHKVIIENISVPLKAETGGFSAPNGNESLPMATQPQAAAPATASSAIDWVS